MSRKGPWVRIPLSPPENVDKDIDSWVLRNGNLRTPSGPEGSSGSETFRVPQGSLAINIIKLGHRFTQIKTDKEDITFQVPK